MRFSETQRRIASYGCRDKRWTLVSGPVGSGKTEAGLTGFLLWASKFSGCQFGILSKGHMQLSAVVKDGIERITGERLRQDRDAHYILPNSSGGHNKLIPLVAQDKRAEQRMRSYNFAGALIDEGTTMDHNVISAMNARCRVGESKIILMTNPDGPLHPLKLQYFNRAQEINGEVIETELRDNPSISESYIESLNQIYTGHMLERMVYGRWVAASGLVYPHLHSVSLRSPGEDEPMVTYDVSIDVGEASVTAALLSGRTVDGKTWIVDEYYHNHVEKGVLTEAQLVAGIRRKFQWATPRVWIVDPSAKSFIGELMRQLQRTNNIGRAITDWNEGVAEVNHWIASGALFVDGAKCPNLMKESGMLIFDENKALIGEDSVVPVPDHACDALRYLVLTRAVQEAGGKKAWKQLQARRQVGLHD